MRKARMNPSRSLVGEFFQGLKIPEHTTSQAKMIPTTSIATPHLPSVWARQRLIPSSARRLTSASSSGVSSPVFSLRAAFATADRRSFMWPRSSRARNPLSCSGLTPCVRRPPNCCAAAQRQSAAAGFAKARPLACPAAALATLPMPLTNQRGPRKSLR